jgi:hypothetical protein
MQVLDKQIEFLNEYNTQRSRQKALEEAINASIRRNKYIFDPIDSRLKADFKKLWVEILEEKSKALYSETDEQTYCEIIEQVKKTLNDNAVGKIKIKISHAQKSLSVYIKHLWCFDCESSSGGPKIKPVHCPVDRIVLDLVGWRGRSWTRVDSVDEHLEHIKAIRDFQNRVGDTSTLSEWEVVNFEKGLSRRVSR